MPIVKPGDKILVTGANGYIPAWVVNQLLKKGYAVRATVRSKEKGTHLQEYFKKFGDKLEIAVVPDITADGAFNEAVEGVDGIEHMASPFHNNVDDPEEFIRPAVDGTVGVLKSALKNNPNLKRIVITSSCAAVITVQAEARTFSEEDWNELSIKQTEELGRKADAMTKYRASKTLAERAAWDFWKAHKSEVNWDIAFINPPMVFGPPIQEVESPEKLNTSLKAWYDFVIGDDSKSRDVLASSNSWIDVRDLADAHVLALEKEAAGGERIIITQGPYVWQEWLDIANSIAPSVRPNGKIVKGYPELEEEKEYKIKYDNSKGKRLLGITYRSKEETTRDTLADFAKRGW
ncbi:D-lactaldehyde dehydrogenase [Ephemerocybe angulata]|uniref:D-lactaldehyde dehydrogenase n=1 Tax=Ephemerocybe angulata TaxID=980116 RepID=A0A8H6I5H9_9AGAR|nr:D-lactaldehyde dehydrogenase [Tulosesus angulatus]